MLRISILIAALIGVAVVACLLLSFAAPDTAHRAWQWLAAPIGGGTEHHVTFGVAWHGRLMVLAWAVLMPAAFVIARFYKITPGQDWPRRLDNPFWFITHRRLGYAIFIVTMAALIFVIWEYGLPAPWHSLHAATGWTVVMLALFQIVGSLLRGTHGGPVDPFTRQLRPPYQWPGDHFDLTRRRILFEYSHKLVGYLLVLLAAWTIVSGLLAADAPRWMWLAVGAWVLGCIGAFVRLQRQGKCIDTYQAIWGLDRTLPGYRRKPIGLGITRVDAPSKDEGS